MAESKKQIIIYSDDSSVRSSIISALGVRVAKDLPEHEIHQFATGPALRAYVDSKNLAGGFRADLFILDGEAALRRRDGRLPRGGHPVRLHGLGRRRPLPQHPVGAREVCGGRAGGHESLSRELGRGRTPEEGRRSR